MTAHRLLLLCGILSSLLYAAMTVVVAMQWAEYSSASRTISELSAIGAPTRPVWVWRAVGGLLLAYGLTGLVWPFAPMHQRAVLETGGGTLSDTMHIALSIVTVLLMLIAISVGAAAFGRRFRLYSIATIVILVVFGVLTFLDGPRIAANLPTPRIGVWERIDVGVFLLWVVVLAVLLLQAPAERPADGIRT